MAYLLLLLYWIFGIYPQGLLPQLAITATVIPGTEIGETTNDGVRFLDNKRIEGTLSEMLDEAIAFCNRNMRTQNNQLIKTQEKEMIKLSTLSMP